jgi:hypothetical protein
VPVVDLTLLSVVQDIVGLLDLLELYVHNTTND